VTILDASAWMYRSVSSSERNAAEGSSFIALPVIRSLVGVIAAVSECARELGVKMPSRSCNTRRPFSALLESGEL